MKFWIKEKNVFLFKEILFPKENNRFIYICYLNVHTTTKNIFQISMLCKFYLCFISIVLNGIQSNIGASD